MTYLESGANIASSFFTTGSALPPGDHERLVAACKKGEQISATPVGNAIGAVCDAAPGIRTYTDLPLITGRYVG
jgi:hypothetical protein